MKFMYFIQEAFEDVVWKKASILPRPQCVKQQDIAIHNGYITTYLLQKSHILHLHMHNYRYYLYNVNAHLRNHLDGQLHQNRT